MTKARRELIDSLDFLTFFWATILECDQYLLFPQKMRNPASQSLKWGGSTGGGHWNCISFNKIFLAETLFSNSKWNTRFSASILRTITGIGKGVTREITGALLDTWTGGEGCYTDMTRPAPPDLNVDWEAEMDPQAWPGRGAGTSLLCSKYITLSAPPIGWIVQSQLSPGPRLVITGPCDNVNWRSSRCRGPILEVHEA